MNCCFGTGRKTTFAPSGEVISPRDYDAGAAAAAEVGVADCSERAVGRKTIGADEHMSGPRTLL